MTQRKKTTTKKAAARKRKPTVDEKLERWETNARYVFEVRQTLPAELRDMCNRWLADLAGFGNRNQITPPQMACAVATMMGVVIQTHVDCAMADGIPEATAINQMMNYFDMAARVELGVLSFMHSKGVRH